MREIETQTFRRNERSFLRDMIAKNLTQSFMQQMRSRMISTHSAAACVINHQFKRGTNRRFARFHTDSMNKEITNAIARFSDRDIDGCMAILERAKSNNPKLPPPGVMMATLWLSANQLAPAREALEATVVKFPADPEAYLKLADLARRITMAQLLSSLSRSCTKQRSILSCDSGRRLR